MPPDIVTVSTFALESPAQAAGDSVIREGLLFRVGVYPDKGFSLTAEELAAAVAGFTPVPLTLEHVPTVLDSQLGELESVTVGPDGETLLGRARLPAWLDALLEEGSRKVSAEWNRATKQLTGLSLVRSPRVTDAALMSAYVQFAGKRNSTADQAVLQQVHDYTNSLGADCAADKVPPRFSTDTPAESPKRKDELMSMWDKVKAYFDSNPEAQAMFDAAEAPERPVPPPPPERPDSPHPKVAELEAQVAAFAATAQRERQARLASESLAFAEGVVRENRATPAEAPMIVTAYLQAAADDQVSPTTVTFGEGQQGSRLDAFKALFAARSPHILTAEMLPPGFDAEQIKTNLGVTNPGTQPMSEDRLRKLLEATPLGEATLRHTNGKGG